MKGRRSTLVALCIVVWVLSARPSDGTLFIALVDFGGTSDGCSLAHWSGIHTGQIYNVSQGDLGKSWGLEGTIRKCSFFPQTFGQCSTGTFIVDLSTKLLVCETAFDFPCDETGDPEFYGRSDAGAVGLGWSTAQTSCHGVTCERSQ